MNDFSVAETAPHAQGIPDGSIPPPALAATEADRGAAGKPDVGPVLAGRVRKPNAAPKPAKPTLEVAARAGPLTVTESGVGRRIVNRRLEGQGERFTAGEVALFSTRVLGGRAGERVRHVWIHEGKAVQSIVLQLRGPDWRTYSRKTLRDAGDWSVEARDDHGHVLASASFTAVPAAATSY